MKKIIMKEQKGFSLVELVIVIAIMAVLVGMLAPMFFNYIEKSRESKDLQDLANIQAVIEAYVADLQIIEGNEITITVKGGDIATVTIGGSAYHAGDLEEFGVKDTMPLGSKKWDDNVLTYNMAGSTYKWSATPDLASSGAKFYNFDGSAK